MFKFGCGGSGLLTELQFHKICTIGLYLQVRFKKKSFIHDYAFDIQSPFMVIIFYFKAFLSIAASHKIFSWDCDNIPDSKVHGADM